MFTSALWLTHPVIQWAEVLGFFRGVKRTEREVDHSPPASAKVKN